MICASLKVILTTIDTVQIGVALSLEEPLVYSEGGALMLSSTILPFKDKRESRDRAFVHESRSI